MSNHGDNIQSLKKFNRSAALKILREEKTISRKRLAMMMGLTPAAVTKIIGEMIEEGIVKEGKTISASSAGRREIEISINPQYGCALGLFVNINRTILSAVRLDGSVIFSETVEYDAPAETEATVEMLCARLLDLSQQHIGDGRILGVGIAVRGIVSEDGRIVKNSYGALDKMDYPLADKVEELTGFITVMTNNVRSLFSADTFMSRQHNLKSGFFLRCEYGIGAALSVNGEIWKGSNQQCSEIGHIPVKSTGGKLCSCGKHGCLETIASPGALLQDCREILIGRGDDDSSLDLDDVFDRARGGDSEIRQIVDTAVTTLAAALKAVLYIIDPDEIVLYGRMFENDYYLTKLTAEMSQGVDARHQTAITKSSFNLLLEDKAAGLAMIDYYINYGGML